MEVDVLMRLLGFVKRIAGELTVLVIVLNAAYFLLSFLHIFDIQARITIISSFLLILSLFILRRR